MRGKEKTHETVFFLLLAKAQHTFLVYLGDQTRQSLGEVHKQVREMVPKQGINIKKSK
jgi:hypothetical protein